MTPALDDATAKRLATAKAVTALWGGQLHALEDDHGRPLFVLTRWELSRSFSSLADVESMLRRAGAPIG